MHSGVCLAPDPFAAQHATFRGLCIARNAVNWAGKLACTGLDTSRHGSLYACICVTRVGLRQVDHALQEAKTRNKKEQGAIEAGEKLARELGLNMSLTAVEADEIVRDPRAAPSPLASPRKDVVGTHSAGVRSSISMSVPSPSPSPSRDTRASSVSPSPSPTKDFGQPARLDLNVDAGGHAAA